LDQRSAPARYVLILRRFVNGRREKLKKKAKIGPSLRSFFVALLRGLYYPALGPLRMPLEHAVAIADLWAT
jgi:hypothetical protein